MATPLSVLIVVNSVNDAELLANQLRNAGFDPKWTRVDNEVDYLASLSDPPDIILTDYSLPQFDALRAADLLRGRGLDVPLILVSSSIGEEAVVEAMKHGVTDYVLKDRIARLWKVVERALEEKQPRAERKRMRHQLALQATALETAENAVMITDRAGTILWVNLAFTATTGYSPSEAIGKTPRLLKSGRHDPDFYRAFWRTICSGQTWRGEFINQHKDGNIYYEEHTVTPVRSESGTITHFVAIMNDVTEHKRLKADAASHERQLTSFFTGATAGLAILDRRLRYVHVNDTLAKSNGVPVQEHLGRTVHEILPQLAPIVAPYLQRVLGEGERVLNVEFSGETPSEPGIERYWIASYFPIAGPDGGIEGIGAIVVEITERKRAEQELKFRNAILSTQQEASIDGILVVNEDGKVVSFNSRFIELWNLPPELLARRDDAALLRFVANNLKDPEAFLQRVQYLYGHSRETSREEVALRDGRVFDRYSAPTFSPDDRFYGRVWYFRDITERKQAELTLQRFANLVDSSTDAIIGESLDGTVISWNSAAERIFGYSAAEMIGQSVTTLLPPDRLGEEPTILDRINRGEGTIYLETRRLRKDGVQIDVAVTISPIKDAEGRIVGASKIGRDITFQKRQAAELEEVQKKLRETAMRIGRAEMARTVVHNIGNVLNGIGVSTALISQKIHNSKGSGIAKLAALLQQHIDDLPTFLSTDPKGKRVPAFVAELAEKVADEQKELTAELQFVGEKVEHIRAIIDAHQTSTSGSGLTEQVAASELVEAALRLNAASLESRGVRVIRQFAPTPPLATEKHKVLQILVNLITNAAQALEQRSPQDRQLSCQIDSGEKQSVRISVADNGMGISLENLRRIFEQGFTTRQGGHGLGLHGSALLARELGGDLSVTSPGPGRGAVFTLDLPVQNSSWQKQ